jgi:NAD(P)-dependent dehydrogenase (short-subunit alcohol dehydrogenase family)
MKWTENEEGTPLKENLIIIHGGGPTAVLNCSLYGAVREAQASGLVEHVYGAVGGTGGLLKEKLLDFGSVPEEELERLYGVKVLACQADGGVEEQVAAVVKQAADTLGRIDFLINNAQNSASGVPLAEHTKEQFDQAIYSGLYAAFFYMKHCYPYLKETKGSVVNFASGAGLFGKPGQSSYAAAKEGIRGMTRVAATEWGPDGINCNLICPLVMTDALKKWREEYPAVYEQTIKGIPAGRFGDPEKDIGRTAVFLCSEDAKYISGETITMQGGSGLRP